MPQPWAGAQHARAGLLSGPSLIVATRLGGRRRGVYRNIEALGRPIDLPVTIVFKFRGGPMSGERLHEDRARPLARITA